MYRRHNNGQISIKEFHLPFGGTLDPENRWVQLEGLIPWDELEETYAPQFSATIGAPAKSVRMAFGALYIGSPDKSRSIAPQLVSSMRNR